MPAVVLLVGVLAPHAGAHVGFGMAVDSQGRVVFLDSGASKVWRIEPDGRLTELARGIHGDNLAQDPAGSLFVQNFNQTMWRIAPDGAVTVVPMPANVAAGGEFGSLDELLAVDGEGNLYARSGNEFYQRSPQVLRIGADGATVALAGGAPGHADGPGAQARFRHVRSAAWGPDGALYVADGTSVRRVTRDGDVTTLVGPNPSVADDAPAALENGPWLRTDEPNGFRRLLGIAVDPHGNVLVADPDNFRVCRISPGGRVSTLRRTRFPWKPTGVTAAGDAVVVMEQTFVPMPLGMLDLFPRRRVVRIDQDGAVTLARLGGRGAWVAGALLALAGLALWRLRERRRRHGRGVETRSAAPSAGPK